MFGEGAVMILNLDYGDALADLHVWFLSKAISTEENDHDFHRFPFSISGTLVRTYVMT